MKSFLARLWVSFHYEGFPHASFWGLDERRGWDVSKAASQWQDRSGSRPGPANLRASGQRWDVPGDICQPRLSLTFSSGCSSAEYLIYKACLTMASQYQLRL